MSHQNNVLLADQKQEKAQEKEASQWFLQILSSRIPVIPEFDYRFGNANQPSVDSRHQIMAAFSLTGDALQK